MDFLDSLCGRWMHSMLECEDAKRAGITQEDIIQNDHYEISDTDGETVNRYANDRFGYEISTYNKDVKFECIKCKNGIMAFRRNYITFIFASTKKGNIQNFVFKTTINNVSPGYKLWEAVCVFDNIASNKIACNEKMKN